MVITKKDLDSIVLIYRIFTLHYKIKIDTQLEFRSLIRAINIQHLKDWCNIVIEDDLVLIDEEVLRICQSSCFEKPYLEGTPDESEKVIDHNWGEWGMTSKSDRQTFEKVSENDRWRQTTTLDILQTNWEDFLNPDEIEYYRDTKLNRWIFRFDSDYLEYNRVVESKRIQELRDYKLNLLI